MGTTSFDPAVPAVLAWHAFSELLAARLSDTIMAGMSIYIDVSAAVHRRAGLGRYGDSLVRELSGMMPDRLALFYNQEQGIEPLRGLEHLPARTISLG